MNFTDLFNTLDGIIGDSATFMGLSFLLNDGILTVDLFDSGVIGGSPVFLCEYAANNSEYPISFAAVDVDELKDQIKHYTRA